MDHRSRARGNAKEAIGDYHHMAHRRQIEELKIHELLTPVIGSRSKKPRVTAKLDFVKIKNEPPQRESTYNLLT